MIRYLDILNFNWKKIEKENLNFWREKVYEGIERSVFYFWSHCFSFGVVRSSLGDIIAAIEEFILLEEASSQLWQSSSLF